MCFKQVAICEQGLSHYVYVICDDDTLWRSLDGGKWEELPAPPLDESKNPYRKVVAGREKHSEAPTPVHTVG